MMRLKYLNNAIIKSISESQDEKNIIRKKIKNIVEFMD